MSDRKFRFGLVDGMSTTLAEWAAEARWAEDAGYDVLLSPDTPNVCAPFQALAAAAAVTTRLRLGTYVLATPTRQPGLIAWEAASLDRLSGGRFELGLGAGRPDAEHDAALLGAPWHGAGRRVRQVGDTITEVKRLFADAIDAAAQGNFAAGNAFLRPQQTPVPPVLVAGAGASLLGMAARQADIIAIARTGGDTIDDMLDRVAHVRKQAGDRFDDIELSVNVWQTGNSTVPPWMAAAFGLDLANATDNKVLGVLNGTPAEAADVLLRRRDEYGLSYITVNSMAGAEFVPILERLKGR